MKLLAELAALFARRKELVGINRRNVELVYAHNPRRFYPVADDKLLGKEYLAKAGVPVPDTLVVCSGLYQVADTVNALLEQEHFVIKPANGSGGGGIVVARERVGQGAWRGPGGGTLLAPMLMHHFANIVFGSFSKHLEDRAFVEKRIVPHPLFDELWPDGLCDIRVITLRGEPVISMVRVPTHRSRGRANLHQGGLGLAVNLDSGKTVRAYSKGESLTHHPESKQPLIGLELPGWPAILEVARRAARAVPLGYLGVDIVVDVARGPLVLEINARPGLEIQNVHGRGIGAELWRAA